MNSNRIKEILDGARYDNFRQTSIEYTKDPYDLEFEVHLLKNFVYRLAFDVSNKPEGVVIKLYDLGNKKNPNSEPELIFVSTEDEMDENWLHNIEFEAPRTRLLVKYEVKDATFPGCVIFVVGTTDRMKK